ncbi:MAG: SPOR domain-containing protein [Bacteroidota bacterium]
MKNFHSQLKPMKAFLFLMLFTSVFNAQNTNIIPALKEIESGNFDEAEKFLNSNIKSNPNDPSLLFLKAVITEDADNAADLYSKVFNEFPNSAYADAALFRLFSMHYANGSYKTAETILNQLKEKYPSSPYIITADRAIPDEEEIKTPPVQVEPVKIIEKLEAEEKYYFTIQAGAFSNVGNARALKNKFEQKNLYSNISQKEVGGTIFSIVTVGRFQDRNEAEQLLQSVNREYKLQGRIIPYN